MSVVGYRVIVVKRKDKLNERIRKGYGNSKEIR
jgi:hypothetical protein